MRPTLSPNGLFFWDGDGWRSLLSADGSRIWNGQAWVPYQAPAESRPSASPPPGRGIRPVLLGAAGGVLLLLLFSVGFLVSASALHVSGGTHASGAESVGQAQLERRYREAYTRDANRILTDSVPFAARGGGPGVCNTGGSRQDCYDTDARVIADLNALRGHLSAIPTPARYQSGDADLQAGLAALGEGFTLRNQAIASGDPNASLAPSNGRIQAGLALLRKAADEFPPDARPAPSLL